MENFVFRQLCEAIDYPDEVTETPSGITLRIDNGIVQCYVRDNRLILTKMIDRSDSLLSQLASYASGRILREDAVLAWDEKKSVCILWQEVPVTAHLGEIRHCFESFMNSCDWWQARVGEMEVPQASFPDIVIKP